MFDYKEVELTGLKIDMNFRATLPLETVARELDYSVEELKKELLNYRYPQHITELDEVKILFVLLLLNVSGLYY